MKSSRKLMVTLSYLILITLSMGCGGETCTIADLTVEVGECTCIDGYALSLDFNASDHDGDFFELFIRNNVSIGFYQISDLPITIDHFDMSGLNDDYLKVVIVDNPDCFAEIEFFPPDCDEGCNIYDLEVSVGECTSEETYLIEIAFQYDNPGNEFFDLFVRNDELIGTYRLDELPLVLEDFLISGNQDDYIKICINDNPDCCIVTEFSSQDCEEECEISELTIVPGECTSDSTYTLTLDFIATDPGNDYFEVFTRNNVLFDFYLLSELPLTIEHFPVSGFDYDFIKVCINDVEDCCKEVEYMAPDC